MLAKRIIPCLDVKDGRVVKGVSFENLRDAGDPVQIAEWYDREGADELCFLDITASAENRRTILDVVARTATRAFVPLTVGGGVRMPEDIRALLQAGADKVSINTAAVENPALVSAAASRFGTQCIVLAIDAKRRPGTGMCWEVYTHGGRRASCRDVIEWARDMVERGAGEILLTSMDRDGTQEGYDLELTAAVSAAVSVPVVASGGAGQLQHLYDAFLKGTADAVLAASIFHYRTHSIGEAKQYLGARGIPIRPSEDVG